MATRFRFRLESLLKLRKALEREAQRQLAREIAALRSADRRITDLQAEHGRTAESRRTPQGGVIDLERWRATERYLVVLEGRLRKAREERREAEEQVSEARRALTRAHQAHLTLVRLKERRQEAHALGLLHQETRELDEIAVLRARFRARTPSLSTMEVNP